jgi:hypothetical protein
MHRPRMSPNGRCHAAAIVRCEVQVQRGCVQEQTFVSLAVKVEPSKTACAWPTSLIGQALETACHLLTYE